MLRIVITGPESSGKTTLARMLAESFDIPYVPEYARIYLEAHGPSYTLADLLHIAQGQLALADSVASNTTHAPALVIDTWMLELVIWAQYRFGHIPEEISSAYQSYPPDLYVLCAPDLPWEPDPLRENPMDRHILYLSYRNAIAQSRTPFIIVSGTGPERETEALEVLRRTTGLGC